jgi:hypothetical protein
MLAASVLILGVFVLAGLLAFAGGANGVSDYTFTAAVAVLLAAVVVALVGVAIRASWSRIAALLAGLALSMTCFGLLLGIPILVAAWRAPDLGRPRTV